MNTYGFVKRMASFMKNKPSAVYLGTEHMAWHAFKLDNGSGLPTVTLEKELVASEDGKSLIVAHMTVDCDILKRDLNYITSLIEIDCGVTLILEGFGDLLSTLAAYNEVDVSSVSALLRGVNLENTRADILKVNDNGYYVSSLTRLRFSNKQQIQTDGNFIIPDMATIEFTNIGRLLQQEGYRVRKAKSKT